MKTASVRDLRNQYASLLRWVRDGEEVVITRRGIAVARLIPERPKPDAPVAWATSPEVTRKRPSRGSLTSAESSNLIAEAGGKW